MWPQSASTATLSAHGVVGPTPEGLTDEQWRKRNMFNTAESRLTAFHEEINRRVGA